MNLELLLDAVLAHGPLLLLGASALLLLGCFLMACQRDPAQRRRHGVATSLALLAYLIVGSVPMPRWQHDAIPAPPFAVVPAIDADARAAFLQRELTKLGDEAPAAVRNMLAPATAAPTIFVRTAPTSNTAREASNAPDAPAVPWSRWLAFAWLLLAALTALRCAFGLLRLRWLLVRSTPLPNAVRAGLDLPTNLRMRTVGADVRPFCAGLMLPIVVVPQSLLHPDRRDELRAVLHHEAAHVRAGDTRLQALFALLSVPLGWHPLFWLLCRDVRFCNELLADDRAAPPERRTAYARALVQLAANAIEDRAPAGTVAVFHRPSDFYRRIQMLLQRSGSLSTSTTRGRRALHTFAMASFVAGTAALFGVPASAQEPTRSAKAMQEENRALRAEIDAMRAELKQLHDLADSLRQRADATPPADLQPDPRIRSVLEQAGFGAADPVDVRTPPDGVIGALQGDPALADQFRSTIGQLRKVTDQLQTPGVPGIGELRTDTTPASNASRFDKLLQQAMSAKVHADPAAPAPSPAPASMLDPHALMPGSNAASPSTGAATEAIADLASRYLDLQADLESAGDEAAELKQLAEAGQASSREAKKAMLKVKTLTRKREVVKNLIEGEMNATEAELHWLGAQKKDAGGTEAMRLDMQSTRAMMRLQALRSVL